MAMAMSTAMSVDRMMGHYVLKDTRGIPKYVEVKLGGGEVSGPLSQVGIIGPQ